jgi:hypothetical protein
MWAICIVCDDPTAAPLLDFAANIRKIAMNQIAAQFDTLPAVEAELHYLAPMAERPRNYTFEPPPGIPRSNIQPESHVVSIRNIRPVLDQVSLDREGFAVVKHHSNVQDFFNEDEVKAVYYPEAEALLKAATGADRVFIFDTTARRRIASAANTPGEPRQPVLRAHVDHTAKSGPERVRFWMGAEAEELLRGRAQIINMWRPVRGPVRDTPLAVADARSIAPHDLVPSDLVYPNRVGETYSLTYNPAHRWFYLPEMQTDEVLLIKCFDSVEDGLARFAPHTAFIDPTTPADAAPRESIELRALVFHYASFV